MASAHGGAPPARGSFTWGGILRWALVVLAVAGLLLAALIVQRRGYSDPDPVLGGKDNRCWRVKGAERAFAKKMNQARRGRKLSLDPELSKAARVHSKEMKRRNLLHHTPQPTLARRVTRWRYIGENVGVGQTVGSLHSAFMNSSGHRHNILARRFRHTGVGVVQKGGTIWVTVIFESRADPGTRLKMPRC